MIVGEILPRGRSLGFLFFRLPVFARGEDRKLPGKPGSLSAKDWVSGGGLFSNRLPYPRSASPQMAQYDS